MTSRGYIVLNIIRGLSIFSMFIAIAAAITTLIKSFILSKFFLFDVLNNIILSLFCLFLILSETSWFDTYYEKRWPLFGPNSSLVSLGLGEVIVGFQLLGMLNERNASKENLGYSFNALLMAAGIVASATGVIVFTASYVYSNSQTHTTARTIRSRVRNASQKKRAKPAMALEEVQVISEPARIEIPQRTYSQSSRMPPPGKGIERSNSAASWVPAKLEMERSPSAASRSPYAVGRDAGRSYSGVSKIPDRSYSTASRTPSSFYSSQPSVADYAVRGNPYAQI